MHDCLRTCPKNLGNGDLCQDELGVPQREKARRYKIRLETDYFGVGQDGQILVAFHKVRRGPPQQVISVPPQGL
jgi:hypothetical protein